MIICYTHIYKNLACLEPGGRQMIYLKSITNHNQVLARWMAYLRMRIVHER
jgi:hypothetical protein